MLPAASDHAGRRPVLSAGLPILAGSMVVFWHADSVAALVPARAAQGVASGLLMSTLSAAIVDLEPEHRRGAAATVNSVSPLAGLALGALVGGLALDASSAPLVVVFGALTATYAVLAAAVWLLPETSARHEGLLRSCSRVPACRLPRALPFGEPARRSSPDGPPAGYTCRSVRRSPHASSAPRRTSTAAWSSAVRHGRLAAGIPLDRLAHSSSSSRKPSFIVTW